MRKITKKLNILLCFEDEFTLHRIAKLIGAENHKVTKCSHHEDFQNYLDIHTYDIVIASLTLQDENTIDLIKLYRFRYAEDATTKFYLFSLDQQVSNEELLDAKIDGVISTLDLTQVFKAA